MKRPGFTYIREAAVRYSVSRGKLHRLIQQGRLETHKGPTDERITLLRTGDLDEMFRFPGEEGGQMMYETDAKKNPPGYLTPELCARMDAVRTRISKRWGAGYCPTARISFAASARNGLGRSTGRCLESRVNLAAKGTRDHRRRRQPGAEMGGSRKSILKLPWTYGTTGGIPQSSSWPRLSSSQR